MEDTIRKPKKRGLVWKLTGIISLLWLIAALLICMIYIQTFRRAFLEEAEEKLSTTLVNMQSRMDINLSDVNTILNELCYGKEFTYFMDADNELSDNEMRYYISKLGNYLGNTRYVYSNMYSDIGIYSANTQISENQYEWQFYLKDLKEKPYFAEIAADSEEDENVYGSVRDRNLISSTTENLKMGDSGIRILPIYRKILSHTKELIGVIEIDIDVARLADREALSNEQDNVGKLLLDGQKNVLFDTMSLSESNKEHISAAAKTEGGNTNVVLDGETFILQTQVCPTTGLISAAVISRDEVLGDVTRQAIQIILIAAICLGILITITFYFVNSTLKRLVVLDHMMGRIGKGDFTAEILADRNEDEISRITQSFNNMARQLSDVMEEKVKHEQAQKDAELRALQAQINPHFLYNTLENMRMQCEIDEYYTISDSLMALSNLFRYSIRWGKNEAPFQLEWSNLKDYLNIMKMRFDEDVEYDLYCEEGIGEIIVPKLMLQPLVENCFNHGFKNKLPPWKLTVKATKQNDKLKIIISDNGAGIEPSRLERLRSCLRDNKAFRNEEKKKNSIGITNVKQRIDMICMKDSTVNVESTVGDGTRIEIVIVYPMTNQL